MAKKEMIPPRSPGNGGQSQARPAQPQSNAAAAMSTSVRNSALPKSSGAGRKQISHEQIAARAYEISQSGKGGSPEDNWLRAERELRGS